MRGWRRQSHFWMVLCLSPSFLKLSFWDGLSMPEKRKLKTLLCDCIIIELTPEIKNMAIEIRQRQAIKTPDAIIAATSKFLELALVTSDKGFKKIKGIELILI